MELNRILCLIILRMPQIIISVPSTDLFVFKVVNSLFGCLGIDKDFEIQQQYFGEWVTTLSYDVLESNLSGTWRPINRWLQDLIASAYESSQLVIPTATSTAGYFQAAISQATGAIYIEILSQTGQTFWGFQTSLNPTGQTF